MSTMTYQGSAYRLTLERDDIPVTMGWTYTADPQWTHTDRQGHEHHHDHGYPTLDHIIDAQHWCDGTEGFEPHDPHWHVDESHYECKECRETIEPGLIPPGETRHVAGATTATLEGPASDGLQVTMVLTEEQVTQLMSDQDAFDDQALAFIDNADERWIIRREYTT